MSEQLEKEKVFKSDIIDGASKYTIRIDDRINKKILAKAYDAIMYAIKRELALGNEVLLYGLGTMATSVMPERKGTNRFGEEIIIPEKRRYVFRGGQSAKRYLNATEDERLIWDTKIFNKKMGNKKKIDVEEVELIEIAEEYFGD